MLGGIGAPRAPRATSCSQCPLSGRQAQLLGSQSQSEVADGKGVWVAQAAHGNHLCGPWSDARYRQQLLTGRVPVAAGVKDYNAIGQPGDQGAQGAPTCRRYGQVGRIDVGELL